MKSVKRFIISLLIGALLAGSLSVNALAATPDHLDKVVPTFEDAKQGDGKIKTTVLYQTFDPYEDPLNHIEQDITVNGDAYYLYSASDPKQIKVEAVIPDTGVWDSDPFALENQNAVSPEAEYEDETGIKVRLVSKELVKTSVEERVEHRELSYDYKGIDAPLEIPDEIEAEFDDGRGAVQTVKTTLPYVRSEVTNEYWDDDFTFRIKVTDYDKPVYDLNGTDVPNGADLNNYKEEFLQMLELDPEFYIIENIRWSGEPYNSGGVVCRDAITEGRKKKKDVTAYFEGDVVFPSAEGYVWRCEYEEILPEDRTNVYTMATDVVYSLNEPERELSWWEQLWELIKGIIKAIYEWAVEQITEHPVRSAAILFLLAGGIIFFLLLGRNKKCKYNEKVKCPYRRPTKEQCEKCIYSHTGQQM